MVNTNMSGMNVKKTLLALLLILTLLVTMTLPAFAEESTSEDASVTESGTVASPEESSTAPEDSGSETTTGSGTTTAAATTTKPASTTADPHAGHDHGMSTGDWISLGIGVAIVLTLVAFAVAFITAKDDGSEGQNGTKVSFRVRGKRYFRSCKSEAKKVVWTPAKTVRKNTLVVVLVMVIFAIVIGLLDWIFTGGIQAITSLLS